ANPRGRRRLDGGCHLGKLAAHASMTRFPRQVQAVLDEMAGGVPRQAESPSVAELRAFYHRFLPLMGEPKPVMAVEDREIPGPGGPIRIPIYRPAAGLRPAAVYFHGGWFSRGDLETHDRLVRTLANASQWVMIAVDYRLAPEAPFPAAPDD